MRVPRQQRPDLIIFDCDGVLIDSQVIQCRVDAAELSRLGFRVTPEELARQFIGTATKDMQAHVEAVLGRSLPGDFEATRDRLVDAAYQTELQAVAGVADVLSRIGLPVCVASNAQLARLREVLDLTDLLSFFEPNVFGADLVPRPKPAPDLFLHAATCLDASPSRCVVIEDSEIGIRAAKAAGMRVLGFHGGGHCYPGYEQRLTAAGASAVFDSMGELLPLLSIAG
jgi:HAD superfamily hydrolase (TIGR01509 family)